MNNISYLKDKSGYEIYNYACKMQNLNGDELKILANYIAQSKDGKYIYMFARDVKNLSKDAIDILTFAITKIEENAYRCSFARDVKNYDIDILIDEEIKRGVNGELRFFACNIPNLTQEQVNKLTYATIKLNVPYGIYMFAFKVKRLTNNNIKTLTEALIATQDAKYIYKFAKDVPKADIDRLVEGIIQTKNAEYIYKFIVKLSNLSQQNIEDLTNALIATKELEYIYKLIKISNKKEELINIIIDSKDLNYIRKLIYSNSLPDKYKYDTKLDKIILESKDNILIAKYLIWLHDLDLINLIFGSLDKLMLFCLINMEELSLDKEKIINIESGFKQIESTFNFNYVDDNAKDYVKNNLLK